MLNCICYVIKPQHECVYRTCVRVCNNGFMLHTLHGKFHIWHNGAFFYVIAYISPIGMYGLPFIEAQLLPYRWPNKCRGSLLGKFVPIYCHCPILIIMIRRWSRCYSVTRIGFVRLSSSILLHSISYRLQCFWFSPSRRTHGGQPPLLRWCPSIFGVTRRNASS